MGNKSEYSNFHTQCVHVQGTSQLEKKLSKRISWTYIKIIKLISDLW